ncbi:hypothetical protein [Ruminococcus flavefaciens]|uniref:hypothetical protein n=1 Tax=Ruminococcus flavefaciens TaxID=1265 RepID=UPI0026EB02DE|nr:hypothetical protein [Ruminococcus flavefaciens]
MKGSDITISKITAQEIRKEMQGNYGAFLAAAAVAGAIIIFCTVFCGTQLGWTHIFAIIGAVLSVVSIALCVIALVKLISIKNAPLFRKYGTAELIANNINDGLSKPRFVSQMNGAHFGILISDKCIVNGGNFKDYLELKDIKRIEPSTVPDSATFLMKGNVMDTVVSTVAVNAVSRMYRKSQGITGDNRYDVLFVTDMSGKTHEYSVYRADMTEVLNVLVQLVPNAQFAVK